MKRKVSILLAAIGWFAIIAQYVLMVQISEVPTAETTIRFFSFFTILTNILVAVYFTLTGFAKSPQPAIITTAGNLTALTVYITIVGLVYQVALRKLWQPAGLQFIVNELLHSVIPLLVILFWVVYQNTKPVKYNRVLAWAIYPLVYFLYTLIRGSFNNYYPYPFVDVANLGLVKVLNNAGVVVMLFLGLSVTLLFIGKRLHAKG